MKKWIALLLSVICLLSLCACGEDPSFDSGSKSSRPGETKPAESTPGESKPNVDGNEYVTVYLPTKIVYEDGISYTYTYNEDCNKIEAFCQDGKKIERYILTLTFDEDGNLVEVIYYENGEEIERSISTYDEDGNLVESIYYEYGEESGRYISTYDEDGNLVESIYYEYGEETSRHTYNEDGNLVETIFYEYGKEYIRYTYSYDKDGNLIEEEWYQEGTQKSYSTYTYDDKNNTVTEHYYSAHGDYFSLISIDVIEKDKEDRVIRRASYDNDDQNHLDEAEPKRLYTYAYDGENQVECRHYENGELVFSRTREYNKEGDIIYEHSVSYDDDYVRDDEYRYEYTYDDDGNITQRMKYFNGELQKDCSYICTYIEVTILRTLDDSFSLFSIYPTQSENIPIH